MVTYPKDWEENTVENIADITTGCRDTEDEWKERHLSEIFDTVTDYVAAGSFADIAENVKYLNQGYAQLVRTVDLKNKFTSKDQVYVDEKAFNYLWRVCLDQEGIILPNVGNCGEVYYFTPEDFPHKHNVLAPNAILVRSSKYNNRFMAYRMMSDDFQEKLRIIISPSGQTKFNKTEFKKLTITIPSVEEQNEIANTLSAFDTYIDDLAELIEKKKAIRDGALEDLMSGRTRLEGFESEWDSCKIGDILKILHGKNQKAVESCNGKYPILGTGGIIGKSKKYLCNWECVLIGRKGTIDRPVYMNSPFWTIDTLYYSKPMPNQCVKFQYYLFCTINWHDYTESSGRPSLSKKVVENIDIKIPSYEEQCAISKTLTSMDEEIESLEAEQEKMIQIREGAMDDLLTGRVRLSV